MYSETDVDELIRISEKAKFWNFYGSSSLKKVIDAKMSEITSLAPGKNYETEIKGFEDIRAADIGRYGSKTTEQAKITRSFKERNITIATVPYGIGISKDVLRIFFEHNGLGEQYLKLIKDFEQTIKSQNKEKAIEIGKQISKLIETTDDKELENFLKSKLVAGKKYAIRSSGIGEDDAVGKDGKKNAFAGIAETE